jgi:hypothetical protein
MAALEGTEESYFLIFTTRYRGNIVMRNALSKYFSTNSTTNRYLDDDA